MANSSFVLTEGFLGSKNDADDGLAGSADMGCGLAAGLPPKNDMIDGVFLLSDEVSFDFLAGCLDELGGAAVTRLRDLLGEITAGSLSGSAGCSDD